MTDAYPIVAVPTDAHREEEYLGTKTKFWYVEPDGRRVLFKQGRTNEDWSEKVATEVAHALGLPAAHVDLAHLEGARGIVSPSFLQSGDQLAHGNEVLLQTIPDYQSGRRYHVAEHTVATVVDALATVGARAHPGGAELPGGFDAVDQLVGYLLLDALVSNTDRHHENWGVVQRGPQRLLAPTFDHASSLGRNERPDRISRRLEGADPRLTVDTYVSKARSALYATPASDKPLSTLAAFEAAAGLRPAAGAFWRARLVELRAEDFESILCKVPSERISDLNRRFAARMLACNRRRIVDGEERAA